MNKTCKHCGSSNKLHQEKRCWYKPRNAVCTTCVFGYKTSADNRICLSCVGCLYIHIDSSAERKDQRYDIVNDRTFYVKG